jgi:hypothetical protein
MILAGKIGGANARLTLFEGTPITARTLEGILQDLFPPQALTKIAGE